MALNTSELFNKLLSNFLEINSDVEALIISDREGFIIAGEKRKNIDMEIVSVLTAIINPILERIRDEFAFKKFGTASFDTDKFRLLFIVVEKQITLSLVLNTMASVDKISPYAYFLAEKSAQILTAQEGDNIQVSIPNFEYEAESSERLKNQIYLMRLDSGGIYRFKFIIIGDHEVGKTSIIRRYVDKKFTKDYRATLGLDISMHSFELYGNKVKISLWDVGAQAYFKRFRKTYYSGAQAAFIVFDLTNRETYDKVNIWFEELVDFIMDKDLPIVIIGNKSDLTEQRQVDYQSGIKLVTELSKKGESKISYIETSALTGENVEDAFSLISYHYIMKNQESEEIILKKGLLNEINSILEDKTTLMLTFISESPFWTPGLQILTEIGQLGDFSKNKDEKEEKIYQYQNGLTLKNYTYDSIDVSGSDGVLCIFDAREKEHIDFKWKDLVIKIIEDIQEKKVVLIGIRVSDNIDWSQLLEEFNINEQLEKKMVSLMFFKIGLEYRFEIYDQLEVMLSTIKEI